MHRTRTPLVKWFRAIYLIGTDKRGLSALALSRLIDVGLKCAWAMLHKIRKAMEARDVNYQLAEIIQVYNAFFNGGVSKRPHKMHAGKGYDYPACRAHNRKQDIVPRIARRGVDSSERLGRHGWVVERTLSWLNRFRKLRIRYERSVDAYLAL